MTRSSSSSTIPSISTTNTNIGGGQASCGEKESKESSHSSSGGVENDGRKQQDESRLYSFDKSFQTFSSKLRSFFTTSWKVSSSKVSVVDNLLLVEEPVLYKKRWLVLLLFSMSNFLCSLYQTTFSSISTIALLYWNMPDETWKINMMSLIYLIFYVPMTSISSYVMKKYGLRSSILIASILNFVGGWIRCLGYKIEKKKGGELYFWIAFLGQSFCAIGQPLISNAPTLLASNWFGEKERTIATTLGTLMGILGSGAAFGFGPFLLGLTDDSQHAEYWTGSEYGMLIMLGGQAALATLLMTCTVAFFKDKPPTPPYFKAPDEALKEPTSINDYAIVEETSESIIPETQHSFFQDLKIVLTNYNFLILAAAYSVGYSVLQSFVTLIDQIIVPKNYTPYDGSIFGITVIVFGIIGATVVGVIADRTKRYKLLAALCGFLATFGFAGFAVVMLWKKTTLLFYMACLCLAVLGMFSVPTVPLCLEMGCEVTYPVPASTSTSIIYGAGTVVAGAILVILDIIQQVHLKTTPNANVSNNGSIQIILWIDLSLLCLSFILTTIFNGKFKRIANEKLHREKSQAYLANLVQEKDETSSLLHY